MSSLLVSLLLVAAAAKPAPTKAVSAKWPEVKGKVKEAVFVNWNLRREQKQDVLDQEADAARLSQRMAPAIPAVWPPTGKGGVIIYAFAAGRRPTTHDGEEVTAPWARVLVDGATWKLEDLGPLKRLGMQGVRPLREEEIEVARTAEGAEQAVVALAKSTKVAPVPLVQKFYCQWAFNNMVISSEVQRLHPEFFKWLACGG